MLVTSSVYDNSGRRSSAVSRGHLAFHEYLLIVFFTRIQWLAARCVGYSAEQEGLNTCLHGAFCLTRKRDMA